MTILTEFEIELYFAYDDVNLNIESDLKTKSAVLIII